jgi:DUF218 domain
MNILLVSAAALALAVVIVLTVEIIVWRAARRGTTYGRADEGTDSEALIVLGYPSTRRGKTHPVQRWRCEIAVRSRHPGRTGVVVFSGGAREGSRSEAAVMADHAMTSLGLPADEIRIEDRSFVRTSADSSDPSSTADTCGGRHQGMSPIRLSARHLRPGLVKRSWSAVSGQLVQVASMSDVSR